MLTRSLPFILALLLQTIWLPAQTVPAVRGVVKDSTGNPVTAASVTIVTPAGAGIYFTKTGPDGRFEWRPQQFPDSSSVKVAMLGFKTVVIPVPHTNTPLLITLRPVPVALQEVAVHAKTPIRQSKDTLTYNVSAFRDKNDRVVADLIARLPGLMVDEKGAISYNGKNISSVYIDGDDLLGGRYRIATNNVPVGAVEQIQVIERDQLVKALEGFVPAEHVSLNLKLAADARATIINTGHAGAGNNVYSGELSNIIFQRKIKSINNLKANNTGENLAPENADMRVSVNSQAPPAHQPYLSMASGELPALDEKYYLQNNDFAGNINTLFSLRSGWKLRLNISAQQLKHAYRFTNAVRYLLPGSDTIAYEEIQDNVYRPGTWLAEAQLEHNGPTAYVRSMTKAEAPGNVGLGNTTQNGQVMQQYLPLHQASFSNATQILKRLGGRSLLQYQSTIRYFSVSEQLRIEPGIHQAIVNDSADYRWLRQQVRARDFFLHQSLTYKTKWRRLVLSAALGGKFENTRLNTGLFLADDHGQEAPADARFANNAGLNQTSLYAQGAVLFPFEKGHLSAEASPALHFVRYPQAGGQAWRQGRYVTPNPVVEFRKQMGKYGELNIRYARETTFGQLQDVFPGTILVNYRQFSSNEAPLPVMGMSNAGIRYSWRKPLKMLFYHVHASAGNTRQNFIRSYTIDRDITRSIAVNEENSIRQYAVNGYLSKYLFFLSTNFSGTLHAGLQEGNTLYNGAIVPFKGYTLRGNATLRKKIGSAITMTVTGEKGITLNRQGSGQYAAIRNVTHTEKIKSEWLHHLHDKFSYKLMYHFIRYRQSPQPAIRNNFLECNVRVAPFGPKHFFELQGMNLLNRQAYRQATANAYQVAEFLMPLRERMLLLKYVFAF